MQECPRVEYDESADALYVALLDADVEATVEIDDLRLVDYATDHRVVGVEFIAASKGIDLHGVPSAGAVEGAIRDAGLQFKVLAPR